MGMIIQLAKTPLQSLRDLTQWNINLINLEENKLGGKIIWSQIITLPRMKAHTLGKEILTLISWVTLKSYQEKISNWSISFTQVEEIVNLLAQLRICLLLMFLQDHQQQDILVNTNKILLKRILKMVLIHHKELIITTKTSKLLKTIAKLTIKVAVLIIQRKTQAQMLLQFSSKV